MPMPKSLTEHPSPAQAYEQGVTYATLLRHIYSHPDFKYQEPPTATVSKVDLDRTPKGLFYAADFIQNTYVNYVIPYLPEGASRKCKELGNPWAFADANYQWEWTWDAEAGTMKDASGSVVEFPRLPASRVKQIAGDIAMRNFFAKQMVLKNETDLKTQMLLGGQTIDFGADAKAVAEKLD